MSQIQSSHRSPREASLLVLAIALVCTICIPLWLWFKPGTVSLGFTNERARRLLLGPEQIACYCAFTWGIFILGSRYWEVIRQRRVFQLKLLPTEIGARILPEDARQLQRKTEQLTSRGGPYVLSNLIRLALAKYAITHKDQDVSDTVRSQADVEMGRFVSSMSTVHFLAWAIPAIGFLGTVRGLGMSLSASNSESLSREAIQEATQFLTFAFDTTLVALAVSLPLMFLLHSVQRAEEALVLDCQQYCLENLVARLYNPDPEPALHDL